MTDTVPVFVPDGTPEAPPHMPGARPPFSARHPVVMLMAVWVLAALACAVPVAVHGPLPPVVHDEFSYLLAGDTFAHGWLTNPAHPHWPFFEAFHTLARPTYMSKYPPGQGLFLALGQVLTGRAYVGVWVSVGVMAAALTWMLQALVPARWAVAGGLLAGVLFGGASDWGRGYWGGAVAASGGALVVGAAVRILARPTVRNGCLLGAGAGLLMFSRPFEGMLTVLGACGAAAALWAARRGGLRRALPPVMGAGAVLLMAGAFQIYYNARVTGSPLIFPYTLHLRQYEALSIYWWDPPTLKTYANESLANFYAEQVRMWQTSHELGFVAHAKKVLWGFASYYVARLGWLPLIAAVGCLSLRRAARPRAGHLWVPLAGLALPVLAAPVIIFYFPHYSAPGLGGLVALAIVGAWRATAWARGRLARPVVPARPWLAPVVMALACAVGFAGLAWAARRHVVPRAIHSLAEVTSDPGLRPQAETLIRRESGPHGALVFVRQRAGADVDNSAWVANGADIDAAPVVWAHDRGDENAALVDYYRRLGQARSVWVLRVGSQYAPAELSRISDAD